MEISEAHIRIAKRQLEKGKSIPSVAGTLMNHTRNDAEFSDLIAIANRAQMELEEDDAENEDESETPHELETISESSQPDTTNNAVDPETTEVSDGASDEDVNSMEIASASDDHGANAWNK